MRAQIKRNIVKVRKRRRSLPGSERICYHLERRGSYSELLGELRCSPSRNASSDIALVAGPNRPSPTISILTRCQSLATPATASDGIAAIPTRPSCSAVSLDGKPLFCCPDNRGETIWGRSPVLGDPSPSLSRPPPAQMECGLAMPPP